MSGGYLEREEVPRWSRARLSWEPWCMRACRLWYWLACATSTSVTFWLFKVLLTCCQLFYYLEDFYFHLKSNGPHPTGLLLQLIIQIFLYLWYTIVCNNSIKLFNIKNFFESSIL